MALRSTKASVVQAGFDVDLQKIFKRTNKELKPISLSAIEEFKCFKCKLLLRQPNQFSCCGRRCCRVCIEDLRYQFGKVFNCPQCGMKVGDGANNLDYTFLDQSCVNDMKHFYTVCNTKPIPCNWQGPLFELELHYEKCENVEIQCTLQCGVIMKRSQLAQHLKIDCALRIIDCNLCQMQIQVTLLQEHMLECSGRKDTSCPFCKAACKSKEQLHEHVHGGQCTEALLSCPLREALGCRSKVKPLQLLQHSVHHIKDVIQSNQRDRDEIQAENIVLQRNLAKLSGDLDEMRKAYDQQKGLIEQYEYSIVALEGQIKQHSEEMANLTDNMSRIRDVAVAKPYGVHSSDLAHLEGNIRSLQNNFERLAREVEAVNMKVDDNTETVGTLQTAMDQCTKAITQVNGMVNEVGLKVDILAVRSVNGILVWKVNELEKRVEEAKTGKILSIYSPPFFTSLHGYRMCLRLYLDGDGQGKGTHLSLFLVIMKSDYDDLLPWPFKQKVTLYLLNQQDPYNIKAHVAQAFRPTETSTSFQKPRGPFNTASGFPKFTSVDKLRDKGFVQDDCMYFKVKVDLADLRAQDYPVF